MKKESFNNHVAHVVYDGTTYRQLFVLVKSNIDIVSSFFHTFPLLLLCFEKRYRNAPPAKYEGISDALCVYRLKRSGIKRKENEEEFLKYASEHALILTKEFLNFVKFVKLIHSFSRCVCVELAHTGI